MSKTVRFAALGQPAVVVRSSPARILYQCRIQRTYTDWHSAITCAAPSTLKWSRVFKVESYFPVFPGERVEPEVTLRVVSFGAVKGSRVLAWGRLRGAMLAHAYDLFDLSRQCPDMLARLGMPDGAGIASRPTDHRHGEGQCCGVWWPPDKEKWAALHTFRTSWMDRTCFLFRDATQQELNK